VFEQYAFFYLSTYVYSVHVVSLVSRPLVGPDSNEKNINKHDDIKSDISDVCEDVIIF